MTATCKKNKNTIKTVWGVLFAIPSLSFLVTHFECIAFKKIMKYKKKEEN